MLFTIGRKVIEITKRHIVLFVINILTFIAVVLILLGYIPLTPSLVTLIYIVLGVIILLGLVASIIKFELIDRIRYGGIDVKDSAANAGRDISESRRIIVPAIFIVLFLIGAFIIVENLGVRVTIGVKSPLMNGAEKAPDIESPNAYEATKRTTTTTTSTTTTTKKPPQPKDNTGFYFFKKEKEGEIIADDCSFDGKGHDAILMPSGNYYCRSNELRVTIYVKGVEKICCVTP